MIYKCDEYKGLKLIVKSEYWEKDSKGHNVAKHTGKYIQFHKGIFSTKDKNEIKFMEEYMKTDRGIIEIDEEELAIRQEAAMSAERKILARRTAMKKDLAKATEEANELVIAEQAKTSKVLEDMIGNAKIKAAKIIADAESKAKEILKKGKGPKDDMPEDTEPQDSE